MQHLDEGTIHAWIEGFLPPDETDKVEEHLGECDQCAEAVAGARGIIAAASGILTHLDDVPGQVAPNSRDQVDGKARGQAKSGAPGAGAPGAGAGKPPAAGRGSRDSAGEMSSLIAAFRQASGTQRAITPPEGRSTQSGTPAGGMSPATALPRPSVARRDTGTKPVIPLVPAARKTTHRKRPASSGWRAHVSLWRVAATVTVVALGGVVGVRYLPQLMSTKEEKLVASGRPATEAFDDLKRSGAKADSTASAVADTSVPAVDLRSEPAPPVSEQVAVTSAPASAASTPQQSQAEGKALADAVAGQEFRRAAVGDRAAAQGAGRAGVAGAVQSDQEKLQGTVQSRARREVAAAPAEAQKQVAANAPQPVAAPPAPPLKKDRDALAAANEVAKVKTDDGAARRADASARLKAPAGAAVGGVAKDAAKPAAVSSGVTAQAARTPTPLVELSPTGSVASADSSKGARGGTLSTLSVSSAPAAPSAAPPAARPALPAPSWALGCYEPKLAAWSMAPDPGEARFVAPPQRFVLEDTPAPGPSRRFTVRPATAEMRTPHQAMWWMPLGVDSVMVTWSAGSKGLRMRLTASKDGLRGTAMSFWDNGDPSQYAEVTARRVNCK
jgi:hypothetical protein